MLLIEVKSRRIYDISFKFYIEITVENPLYVLRLLSSYVWESVKICQWHRKKREKVIFLGEAMRKIKKLKMVKIYMDNINKSTLYANNWL